VQVVPARLIALGLSVLVCAGTLALAILHPGKAAAEDLQVSALVVRDGTDRVELRIAWSWVPPADGRGTSGREELLAVSFDPRRLVFDSDAAPAGRGANGEMLRRLERAAGPDGTRRLYVMQGGVDGTVTLRFRSVWPGLPTAGAPFRVHVLFGLPTGVVMVKEIDVIAP